MIDNCSCQVRRFDFGDSILKGARYYDLRSGVLETIRDIQRHARG